MPRKQKDRSDQLRVLIAQEAARIIVQQGVRDYLLAKQKAADKLGLSDRSQLPRNTEVEQAVLEYQRLFAGEKYDTQLEHFRNQAREAMTLFEQFQPRLVGSVLSGTVTDNSSVDLHVFADTVEEVVLHLMHNNIPYEEGQWRGKKSNGERLETPKLRFFAGQVEINLMVFPSNGLRQAPLSPVDGKPMKRINLAEMDAL